MNEPTKERAAAWLHIDEIKELCRDFSSRTGSVYIKDVASALDGLAAIPCQQDSVPSAHDVLRAIVHARDAGQEAALILDENSPLLDAARIAISAAPVSERAADGVSNIVHMARQRWQNEWTYTAEQICERFAVPSSTDPTPQSPDGRVTDKAMVKRLAIQHGLIPSSGDEAKAGEREAFEHHERASDLKRDEEGDYVNPCVQSAWEGWQARAALASAQQSDAPAAKPVAWHDGVGLLWDVYSFNKWSKRVVSPIGWDAENVYQYMVGASYAPHIDVRLVSASNNYKHPAAVPVAEDARDAAVNALRELVSLKDLKDRLQSLHEMGHGTDYDHYHKAKPRAWEAARKAIAALAADQSGDAK